MDGDITLDDLKRISAEVPNAVRTDDLNNAMIEFEINTPLRQAAFLAQILEESDQLRCFSERWGPTVDQERYEMNPRLGNVLPGDGFKFRGRGAIQLTGRANYAECGAALGLNLTDDPDLVLSPTLVYRVAGWYWRKHGLNILADGSDIVGITRAINGIGMYGLAQRKAFYAAARKVLGVDA